MRNNELEKLPHCSAEISRCLDDLINMFDGGENDLAEKLQLVRKKLRQPTHFKFLISH